MLAKGIGKIQYLVLQQTLQKLVPNSVNGKAVLPTCIFATNKVSSSVCRSSCGFWGGAATLAERGCALLVGEGEVEA